MRWTDAPLTDADFARIRANVLAEAKPRPSWAPRLAFATAAIVALLFVRLPRIELPTAPPRNAGVHAGWSAGFQPAAVDLSTPVIPAVQKAAFRKTETPPPQTHVVPMRIEIQTTDPDIRIIWIVSSIDQVREES